jgi:hypothetical protein
MNDSDGNVNNDFEYARQTYHDILAKGSAALDDMMEVARSTEHPRAFEVLSTLMKTMSDVNGDLLSLHKKKKDLTKTDQPCSCYWYYHQQSILGFYCRASKVTTR